MRTAVLCFTDGALNAAKLLVKHFDAEIFFNKKTPIKSQMEQIWNSYDAIVFICTTGIAVRYISKFVADKTKDPAVVVMDEGCKFSISLLSGHLGGANELAIKISEYTGATAVVTTASDVVGVKSIDMFAVENDLVIEDISTVAKVMARVVEGAPIAVISDVDIIYQYDKAIYSHKDFSSAEAVLIISDKKYEEIKLPHTALRPKTLCVGIGCRRGASLIAVSEAVQQAFNSVGLSEKSIYTIASIDIKANEAGIVEYARSVGVSYTTFSAEQLSEIEGDFSRSDFVKQTVGVDNVSSRCALMYGGELLVDKYVCDGVTVSIARRAL